MVYWVTGAVLLVYLLLVWFFAGWINPPGAGIWVLRIGLWLIGILGAVFTVWWFWRKSKLESADPSSASAAGPGATTEVDLLVRDAIQKLKRSAMGRGGSLRNLPLIFLVGDPGSAKTTTIIHSALDPELLAGHVYQDNAVVPTRVANFWYTRQAVFVDGGGQIFSQPDLWRRLIRLVQPGRVAAAGKQQQAPRAAIVCFDCEVFRPGCQDAVLSAARRLGTRLLEISQLLGISFPIYILFTRADRIGARPDGRSAFLDYVAGLPKNETSQVLGTTLPVRSLQATGVYADEETKRLEKAFDDLFYSLAEKRVDFLSVTSQSDKVPGIYEFPRELRKIRQYAVPFLVELGRPSQLSVNPFLRGFYFAGVRESVVEGAVASAPQPQVAEPAFDGNATVVFGAGGMRAGQMVAPPPRVSGPRKVPEWIFLSQLFNEVLLKDRVALSASGFSSRVSLLRRVALACVIGIALVFAIGFLTSFIGNFFLEQKVKQAVADVNAIHATPGQTPSLDQLTRLDTLRQQLEPLSAYYNHTKSVPWSLRWWLYSGDDFYPSARLAYFQGFRDLLFAETQGKLLTSLRTVKDKPDPNDSYEATYNILKAYLITTSHREKSSKDFLTPVLYNTWANGRSPDEQAAILVRNQFDFYSGELLIQNPYSSTSNTEVVDHARFYLSAFSGIDRYYLPLKANVSRQVPSASFARRFRDASDVVICSHDVEGAFTPEGYSRMQDAIARNLIASEDWVLTKQLSQQLDQATLQRQLTDRYNGDFVKEWRTVLQSSSVRPFASFHDGDVKLGRLISPSSPLLELFWFISHNTHVPLQQIMDSFQPVQTVVPDGPPDQYILGSNQGYIEGLTKLRSQVSLLANNPAGTGDQGMVTQALQAAGEADGAVTQLAQKFRVDPQFHVETVTQTLLTQPIDRAKGLVKLGPIEALNGGGRALCADFSRITDKFPFNASSSQEVPIEQVNALLAPISGSLWKFYSQTLAQYLPKQGSRYSPKPSPSVHITPQFENFFNHAATLSESLYANGMQTPHSEYSLRQAATTIDGVALKVGNEALSGTQQKTFVWTGSASDTIATTVKDNVDESASGPWALFHFIKDSRPTSVGPGVYDLQFVKQINGRDQVVNGKTQYYTYELHFLTGNPWAGFSGVSCVSQVAR